MSKKESLKKLIDKIFDQIYNQIDETINNFDNITKSFNPNKSEITRNEWEFRVKQELKKCGLKIKKLEDFLYHIDQELNVALRTQISNDLNLLESAIKDKSYNSSLSYIKRIHETIPVIRKKIILDEKDISIDASFFNNQLIINFVNTLNEYTILISLLNEKKWFSNRFYFDKKKFKIWLKDNNLANKTFQLEEIFISKFKDQANNLYAHYVSISKNPDKEIMSFFLDLSDAIKSNSLEKLHKIHFKKNFSLDLPKISFPKMPMFDLIAKSAFGAVLIISIFTSVANAALIPKNKVDEIFSLTNKIYTEMNVKEVMNEYHNKVGGGLIRFEHTQAKKEAVKKITELLREYKIIDHDLWYSVIDKEPVEATKILYKSISEIIGDRANVEYSSNKWEGKDSEVVDFIQVEGEKYEKNFIETFESLVKGYEHYESFSQGKDGEVANGYEFNFEVSKILTIGIDDSGKLILEFSFEKSDGQGKDTEVIDYNNKKFNASITISPKTI
ncbi:hypothetical protein C0585_06025 [Candidatus Woesearchaeota archaeon]|nr:MAG: hypothetical protein C0585_06025 [Candidatus Woesearchaeota archaeon]